MSTTEPGLNSPTTVGSRSDGAAASTDDSAARDQQQGKAAGTTSPSSSSPSSAPTSSPGSRVRTPPSSPASSNGGATAAAAGPATRSSSTGEAPRLGQARQGQVRPGQPGAAQPNPGQVRPGQPRAGQPRAGQPRAGQPRAGQLRPGAGPARSIRKGPRKARLSVARLDPWSVLKLSFLLSVALGIVGVVVTAVVWNVIAGMGVFSDINEIVRQVDGEGSTFDVLAFVGFERMISLSIVISVANVVILTALATLFAFIYNIGSGLVGGLHVTLTDE